MPSHHPDDVSTILSVVLPYSRLRRRRVLVRRIFWVVLAIVVSTSLLGASWGMVPRARVLWDQRECAAYPERPESVVYVERAGRFVEGRDRQQRMSLVLNKGTHSIVVGQWPPCLSRLARALEFDNPSEIQEAILFLGTMVGENGENRIVAVTRSVSADDEWSTSFSTSGSFIIRPATIASAGSVQSHGQSVYNLRSVPFSGEACFSIYQGRIDHANKSHITMRYTFNGEPGTIDGWLVADHVPLSFRDGPLAKQRLQDAEESRRFWSEFYRD
jgi:hypothetical protein